ncbi:hypothetical protein H5398_11175 [Tessaracoccus sp. MC1679]|uniref:hypothetical protein n=1 Tax=Tessaracoccus sp. MC1679 TaxID=2760313 RepID=UPI001601EF7E|nr:hypothetical protein [Tessaracoccus sp. MC1679]MBB1516525.1 hypothetical protein [Tessaracoccus sp. MC1679]
MSRFSVTLSEPAWNTVKGGIVGDIVVVVAAAAAGGPPPSLVEVLDAQRQAPLVG